MSFFGSTYSTTEHSLSSEEIRALVGQSNVPSLTPEQEKLVEDAIRAKRHGDGKISLQQIYEALSDLKHAGKISETDRAGVMHVFKVKFRTE